MRLDIRVRKVSAMPLPYDHQYALAPMLPSKMAQVRPDLEERSRVSKGKGSSLLPETLIKGIFSPDSRVACGLIPVAHDEVRRYHPTLHSRAGLRTSSPVLARMDSEMSEDFNAI